MLEELEDDGVWRSFDAEHVRLFAQPGEYTLTLRVRVVEVEPRGKPRGKRRVSK